ncbi:S26 family signal peptidase [Candidatus Microgenomates bacterium]|nr:S26 family signal peptidase [Candidatus Microgenomates bacterium]
MNFPLILYKVIGSSMSPTHQSQDFLIGWRWFRPKVGKVVVAKTDRLVIKRVMKIDGDRVWLEGDNSIASTDSRHIGWIPREKVKAKIIRSFRS